MNGRLQGREVLGIWLKRDDLGKVISSGAPKLRNGIAVVSAAVYEDLVPAELKKILRKILNSRMDYLASKAPKSEPHLAIELLTSLFVQQGSPSGDLFRARCIIIWSLPKEIRQ